MQIEPLEKKESPILTITELTEAIKRTVETTFPHVFVQGEVSNFRQQSSSGHLYFTLKDANCQIAAIMFRGDAAALSLLPKEGDQVVVRGELNVYGRGGKYQIIARSLRLAGIGELLLKLEELKAKIHKKGWFRKEHKKPLPHLPKTIGVVTSPTGAAIQDILNILKRRFSNFHLILNPVRVQGDTAAKEIAQAIEQFNTYRLADVLIVCRGGGSIEDLWAFNEECVAEAIFNSHIPIIAAVGHETDHCIAEYVADIRAPTPSAAAEIVIAEKADLLAHLMQRKERLRQIITQKVRHEKERLDIVKKQPLIKQPARLIEPWLQKIDDVQCGIDTHIFHLLDRKKERLLSFRKNLQALKPTVKLSHYQQKLLTLNQQLTHACRMIIKEQKQKLIQSQKAIDQLTHQSLRSKRQTLSDKAYKERLDRNMKRLIAESKQRLKQVTTTLETAHPKTLFARGYSIVFSEKEHCVISSVHQLTAGKDYQLIFSDGRATTTIKDVKESDKKRDDF